MNARTATPQEGFFRVHLVPQGPWVPAAICRPCACTVNGGADSEPHEWSETCDRFPPLSCFVDGVERPDYLQRAWIYGKPIDRAEHDFMIADAAWTREHAPAEPKANPTKPIDLSKMKSLF